MNDLIRRIINLRESNDWSQAELARRLGVEKSVMNKIENGTRKVSSDELIKLSELFSVTTDFLLGKNSTPDWATQDDLIQLEDMLKSNVPMAYNGVELNEEDKKRINAVLTQVFWERLKEQKEQKEK